MLGDIIIMFKGFIAIAKTCYIDFTDNISLSLYDLVIGFLFVSICMWAFYKIFADRDD